MFLTDDNMKYETYDVKIIAVNYPCVSYNNTVVVLYIVMLIKEAEKIIKDHKHIYFLFLNWIGLDNDVSTITNMKHILSNNV